MLSPKHKQILIYVVAVLAILRFSAQLKGLLSKIPGASKIIGA